MRMEALVWWGFRNGEKVHYFGNRRTTAGQESAYETRASKTTAGWRQTAEEAKAEVEGQLTTAGVPFGEWKWVQPPVDIRRSEEHGMWVLAFEKTEGVK